MRLSPKTQDPKKRKSGFTNEPERPSTWRFIAHFTIACLLTYGLERWLHYAVEESGQSHNFLTQSLFELASFYHRVVTASPRKPTPRFTSLVTLSERASPRGINMTNICYERQFLGELLKSLSNAHPNVVMIDKYFGPSACSDGDSDPGTRNLFDGVQALCRSHATVIVGRKVNDEARTKTERLVYPLDPTLAFNFPMACVAEGVLNMDLDLRRVVLWWPNVGPVSNSQLPPPTVALAAATAASPMFLGTGRLASWTPNSPSPYVSFVQSGQFDAYNMAARDLVCKANGPQDWRACSDDEIGPKIRSLIQGRVVVIGEDFPEVDRHETVVGNLPGYILQANYIESLLDDRLIRPMPALSKVPEILNVDVLVGFLIFFCFEYLAWHYHHHRVKALAWITVLFLGAVLTIYLSVSLLGYYLDPATVCLLAVLLRVADLGLMPPAPTEPEKHR